MWELLLASYLCGWVIAAAGLYFFAQRFADDPAPNPVRVSVLGGALWPLLLVGLMEASSIVVWTRLQPKPAEDISVC